MADTNKPSKRTKQPLGITAITVCGYKSIANRQTITIRPLTILAGPNSSGKSSIMQPLLLMKQTLDSPYDPGPLLLNGDIVPFTTADQVLSRNPATECPSGFFIECQNSLNDRVRHVFKKRAKTGLELESMEYYDGTSKVGYVLKEDLTHGDLLKILPKDAKRLYDQLNELRNENPGLDTKKLEWGIARDRCFLRMSLRRVTKIGPQNLMQISPTGFVERQIEQLIHVPALRGNPVRLYRAVAVGSEFPGSFPVYVASVIKHWQRNKPTTLKKLSATLEKLGLTCRIEAKPKSETEVELYVNRLPHLVKGHAKDLISIADVGFGVSQVLPVIVALLTAKPDQIVYIEEPEIHLHPRAQYELASILTESANRGVKIIVETHSSLLLRGIQTYVAEGKLSPDKVALHWFSRENDTGNTVVASANLERDGSFGRWPENFDDVSLSAESRYIEAVEKVHGGG